MIVGFWHSLKRRFAASLRLRVLTLTLAAFVVVSIPAGVSFVWLVDRTVATLGTLFAEKQILYDRYRGLEALRREVALAETLMRSPTIIDWARNENGDEEKTRGIAELEHFRRTFSDRSYFFVVNRSGNYYFNDHNGSYTGRQHRYTVDPNNPDDSWYYKTVATGPGCHLNVNHDTNLGVTKVWMNCVMQKEGEVVGVVGTGIDLTHFLRNVVETDQPGVESIFVDASGAVQANRDESLIDFRSLTKEDAAKKTFFRLLDNDADRSTLSEMMQIATTGNETAIARFMNVNGRQMLVGIGHLAELGWYNITVMDVHEIIDYRLFGPIALMIALATICAAALVTFLFKRNVLDRLARAEASVRRIEAGDFSASVADGGADEISRLAGALDHMAAAVGCQHASLEAAVRERTEQLERIAYLDQLSGVLNRRGFIDAFHQNRHMRAIGAQPCALLILDIDNFKQINDTHGHMGGDAVIAEVAKRLLQVTREDDLCARWGGDEFMVVLWNCDATLLAEIGEKILNAIRLTPIEAAKDIWINTSIGAHNIAPGESLEAASTKADVALYEAKRLGRNRLVVYDAARLGTLSAVGRVA